jgi:uncharacterized small protein (DUF1192 family)
MSVNAATASRPDRIAELRRRIASLRAEISAAEAKIPRTREAILIRRRTLARLEARLALEGESRPAYSADE